MKPIKPSDIATAKQTAIPEVVIEVINNLLALKFSNGRATIYQKDIVNSLLKNGDISKDEIFNLGYLNFEEIYREQGWKVTYDKPGYGESYDAFFEFKVK